MDKILIDRSTVEQALDACEQRLPLNGQAAIIDELNNLRAALAEPVQEPVGSLSVRYHRGCKSITNTNFNYYSDLPEGDYELYTAPPQPKPLTDELLRTLHHEDEFGLFCDYNEFEQIARAIEAALGIKE